MKNLGKVKWMAIILFVVSVIPLLIMGVYARPLLDDFNWSIGGHRYLEEHNPLFLLAPFFTMVGNYFAWQGTYAAEILFALQPGAWPVPAYWFTTVLIIGSLSFAYIFFWSVISEVLFNKNRVYGGVLGLFLLILQFQYVPYLHQGFYWYNGAVYYSFFFALFLLEMALLVKLFWGTLECDTKRIVRMSILAFIISGGNYSTALCHCIILVMLTALEYITVKKRTKGLIIITIAALSGLIISMIAPGNVVRASSGVVSMSAPSAIFHSIMYALRSIKRWTNIPQIGLFILILPILYFMIKNADIRFRYPIIAIGFMFGIYAAQMTPVYYALSYEGGKRQIDMYYYSYYILLTGCTIYMLGWLLRKSPVVIEKIMRHHQVIMSIGLLIIVFGIVHGGIDNTNAFKTGNDILSGRAAAYVSEYDSIINSINEQGDICHINDIEQWTNSLENFGIQEDPEDWRNKSLAEYYGKEKIYLKSAEN